MPRLCQIALSVTDLARTRQWFVGAFGMLAAGGAHVGGPQLAAVQGLPEVEADVAWLVDRQEFFQLELFRFSKPRPRRWADGGPSDAGYPMFGIHVWDFEAAIERLATLGSAVLKPPTGALGARRVRVRDPDGILIEIAEDDPRGPKPRDRPWTQAGCAVRWIRVSVPSMERAISFWVETLGLRGGPESPLDVPADGTLSSPDSRARQARTLWAHDIAIELVESVSPPARPRPAGYRISDVGVVNVALGGPELDAYETVRARSARYAAGSELVRDDVRAVYLTDDQGFSVELLYRSAATSHLAGFVPDGGTWATTSPTEHG